MELFNSTILNYLFCHCYKETISLQVDAITPNTFVFFIFLRIVFVNSHQALRVIVISECKTFHNVYENLKDLHLNIWCVAPGSFLS